MPTPSTCRGPLRSTHLATIFLGIFSTFLRRKEGRKAGRKEGRKAGRQEGVSVRVVLKLCLSVCLTVTHFFSGRGALTVTTLLLSSQHIPSLREWQPVAPSAIHPMGSTTKGSRALLSPMVLFPPHRRVLCQVPACWWREGLKCAPADQLLAARLHVLLRRPGVTLSRSSTNISRLGRAMGLWVIAVGVRPTSHNCYPQVTKAVSHLLCVDQHRTTV